MRPPLDGRSIAVTVFILALCPALAVAEVSISDAVLITEATHKGTQYPIDVQKHLRAVDLRSRINIDFDHEALRHAAARFVPQTDVIPPESPEAADQRSAATNMITALRTYLEEWDRLQSDLAAFRTTTFETPESRQVVIENLEERVAAAAEPRGQWLDLAKEWVLAKARADGLSTEEDEDGNYSDEVERRLEAFGDRLLPDSLLFDPLVLADILNEQYEFLSNEMRATLQRLASKQTLHVSVRAFLLRPSAERPLRLHVEGYDVIEVTTPPKDKGLLGLNESELEELQRRYGVAEEFARFANDLRADESDLRSAIATSADSIRAWMKDLNGAIQILFPAETGQRLLEEIQGLFDEVTSVDVAVEARTLKRLAETWEAAQSIRARLEKLSGDLPVDPMELIAKVNDLTSELSDLGDSLKSLIKSAQLLPDDLDAVAAKLDEMIRKETGELQQRARRLLSDWKSDLGDDVRPAMQALMRYELVVAEIQSSAKRSESRIGEGQMATALDDFESIRPRPLDDVVQGSLFLNDYRPSHGDEVRVVVELLKPEGNGFKSLDSVETRLRVVRFGGYSRIEASLIFVERVNEPEESVTTSFLASPALSLTAHFRKREQTEGADGWATAWNSLNPGVGVNVTALSFEGRSGQYGVGFQFTMFGDVLQAGYGWNLNVGTDREYWFVGVGLIDALDLTTTAVTSLAK